MAVEVAVSPAIAIRSSLGVELWTSSGPKIPYGHKPNLPKEETKNCRSISFSPDGRFFAYSNGQEIKVLQTKDWQLQCTLPRPKALYLKFSPRGNYLCTWELYVVTKDKPEGSPNLYTYELSTGIEVFSVVQKIQTDWEPSWSSDESIFAMVVGGEALFYDLAEGVAGFKSPTRKIGGRRGCSLSLGPGSSPPFIAFYTPGVKDLPSMCKLYKYPALAQNQPVSQKSFFQADRVELLWNKHGTGLLLFTSTEVDKSGASYYGNQALHFMSTKGDSCSVPLSKEGPVHCVKWSSNANEFLVVYGFMPSKATLYNLHCNVIFDFGEGPRNCAYFNAFGNLVVLAGFGNLPGNVEIWDVNKREKLSDIKCSDTTQFEWSPNGQYFITATTAPRLRIGNGFKVYHYSGSLMHETMYPQGQELLSVEWQQFPENTFKEPEISKMKQEGIKSSQPEASKKVYTPPHLRMTGEGKNPEKYVPQPQVTIPGLPPGYSSKQSNSNKKNGSKTKNQRHDKQKYRKESIAENNSVTENVDTDGAKVEKSNFGQHNRNQQARKKVHQQQHQHQQQEQQQLQQQSDNIADSSNKDQGNSTAHYRKKTLTSEKERKIRSVAKKLADIKKLKARQEQGETLELNQVNKIAMESKFLEELKALKLTS